MDLLEILAIPGPRLGEGTGVRVRFGGDSPSVCRAMADEMADVIRSNNAAGRPTCFIVPVGPVDQYEPLAATIEREALDCSNVTFINMDEFLGDDGGWIDPRHPLSFRGFMERVFYDQLPISANFRRENQVFPDPRDLDHLTTIIADRGGVDVAFGGIGLNGHLAFNEPESVPVEVFAARSSRTLDIAPESRAHMAINIGCVPEVIPRRAVTVGMKEILAARRISLYANRPWQRGVVRLALHGPIAPSCPASYLRRHPDARLTLLDLHAEPVEVRLR